MPSLYNEQYQKQMDKL